MHGLLGIPRRISVVRYIFSVRHREVAKITARLLHFLFAQELDGVDIDPRRLRRCIVGLQCDKLGLREYQSGVSAFDEVNCGLSPGFLDELNDG